MTTESKMDLLGIHIGFSNAMKAKQLCLEGIENTQRDIEILMMDLISASLESEKVYYASLMHSCIDHQVFCEEQLELVDNVIKQVSYHFN